MHIKIDFSTYCREHDCDVTRGSSYSIYTKKHWWNKWKEIGTPFADLGIAKYEAEKMASMPIRIK